MSKTNDTALFTRIAEEQNAGRPLVLATVVRKRGSAPRETGARMLIWADGTTLGSVGGGCAESLVVTQAREILLRTQQSVCTTVSLADDTPEGTGDVCGGQMELFLEYIYTEMTDGLNECA